MGRGICGRDLSPNPGPSLFVCLFVCLCLLFVFVCLCCCLCVVAFLSLFPKNIMFDPRRFGALDLRGGIEAQIRGAQRKRVCSVLHCFKSIYVFKNMFKNNN